MTELTDSQATDLARHFLGPRWTACKGFQGAYCLMDGKQLTHVNSNWRDVFRMAGVALPSYPRFISTGLRVMHGSKAVCTAVSNTTAKRIANALNKHDPDRRGQ
jgi:hypothetical protein